MKLIDFIMDNKVNEQRPLSRNISEIQKLTMEMNIANISTKEKTLLANNLEEKLGSIEFIDELSNKIGEPRQNESKSEFVNRGLAEARTLIDSLFNK